MYIIHTFVKIRNICDMLICDMKKQQIYLSTQIIKSNFNKNFVFRATQIVSLSSRISNYKINSSQ